MVRESERERLGGGIRVLFVVSWSFLLSFLGTEGRGVMTVGLTEKETGDKEEILILIQYY